MSIPTPACTPVARPDPVSRATSHAGAIQGDADCRAAHENARHDERPVAMFLAALDEDAALHGRHVHE